MFRESERVNFGQKSWNIILDFSPDAKGDGESLKTNRLCMGKILSKGGALVLRRFAGLLCFPQTSDGHHR